MLYSLKKKDINHILLNARVTKKSFKRWIKLGNFSKKLFQSFNCVYPQNEETLKHLNKFKVKNIKKIGNLKFSESILDLKETVNQNLKNFLNHKKYWCAASTHEGEELVAANTHIAIQKKISNLVTIIIPRNIQRTQEIVDTFSNLGLKFHLHSFNKKIPKNTQIYVVDTYGETKA